MIGEQQRVFWRLMEILQECDLSSKWMLIGSWSEVVYEKAGLLVPEWSALMVTRDVDFLIPEKTMRIDSDNHHIPLAKKLSVSGFNVLVPDPRAYVVQKMMVNTFRTDEKREKDLVKIQSLMQCRGGDIGTHPNRSSVT